MLWILTPDIKLKKNVELMKLCSNVKETSIMWIEYQKIQIIVNNNEWKILIEGKETENPKCVYFNSYSKKVSDESIYDSKTMYIHKILCEYLNLNNIRIINSSKTILYSVDKYSLYQICNKLEIKCPKSCIIYPNQSRECYKKILENFNYPVIIKYPIGSGGNFVWKIENFEEFEKMKWEHCIIIQEMILDSYGKDVRVCVIGKEIAFAYERKSKDAHEFRSNIEKGGERKLIQVDEKLEKLVTKIIADLEIEIGGIDLLYGENEMIVCEITLGFPIFDVLNSLDEMTSESKEKLKKDLINYLVKRTVEVQVKIAGEC
jgi:RimK family alpha-L-glutamate ligase